jgi:3-oxoacyl-(acyl-carrier-protein) synthase
LTDAAVRALGLSKAELADTAVFAGTCTGVAASEEIAFIRDRHAGLKWQSKFLCGGPGRLAAFCAQEFGARGPQFTYTTACTSTAVGAVMAARMLRQGRINRALVIGLDLVMKLTLEGFRLLQLYSEAGCRPFDARRDGLYLGEACAAFVLERGDGPLQFLDGAIHHDPGHIAAGSTDGTTAAAVMNEALTRSGVRPGEVTAVKAHGTGTPTNDLTELNALSVAFGGKPPPFSSLKSTFGHTLGASAALELVTWTWCAEGGFMPATYGFQQKIAESPHAPQIEPRALGNERQVHLFNAFGFGGTSVSFLAEVRR